MYKKKSIYLIFTLVLFGCLTFSTAKADELTSQGGVSFYEQETASPEVPNEDGQNENMGNNEINEASKPSNVNNTSSNNGKFPQTGEKRQRVQLFLGVLLLIVGIWCVFIKFKIEKKDIK